MAKLSDKQCKKIIADYINGESMRSIARRYKVAASTIKRVIERDPETERRATDKKEQNTKDILAHMDGKKEAVCALIDTYLKELVKPDRLEDATVSQLSTALGTIIDKFTLQAHRIGYDNARLELERIKAKTDEPEAIEQDGFMDALKAEATEVWADETGDIPV